jgi:hypothetical protein
MNDLVEQVLKLKSNFYHTYGKLSVKEVIKLGPIDYLYEDKTRVFTQSRVIEHIILGLDLPALHIIRELDIDVIRGDDLIIPVIKFEANALRLEGLDVLTKLEGMIYSDLPSGLQKLFLNYNFDTLEFPLDINMDFVGYIGLYHD